MAKRAGVSVATVSAVINGSRPVSDELRKRVQQAIAELDYRPNLVARALYTRRTQSLGLLVPSITNPFFAAVVKAAEETAHEKGYAVFVGNTDGDPAKSRAYADRMLAMGVDGLLVVLSWDVVASGLIETFRSRGVPVVGVAGGRLVPDIDCFVSDDVGAGKQAANYLISLGHRNIAFIGAEQSKTTELRYTGAMQAFAEAGIEADERLLIRVTGYTSADAAAAVSQLLARGVAFTGLLVFNDVMAVGALDALESQGLSVPEQVSICGFDDTVSVYSRPRLTTVACPSEALGRSAVGRLLQRIGGDKAPPEVHTLPTKLIVRESTRARLSTESVQT